MGGDVQFQGRGQGEYLPSKYAYVFKETGIQYSIYNTIYSNSYDPEQ